ncbi:MAG: carboxypeptidase regulatory-like domain-containing protein [Terriglobales bacterium]
MLARHAAALALLLALPVAAQITGTKTLLGEVLAGQQPVGHVLVTLENQYQTPMNQTQTDLDGRFTFSGLAGAVYYISINAPGYAPALQMEDLGVSGQQVSASIFLHPKTEIRFAPRSLGKYSLSAKARRDYERGEKLLAQGQYKKAIAPLSATMAAAPTFAPGYADLGSAYFGAHKTGQARKVWQKALSLDGHQADAAVGLARLQNDHHHWSAALKLLARVASAQRHAWPWHLEQGRAEYGLQRWSAATTDLTAALPGGPSQPHLYLMLSNLDLRFQRLPQARGMLESYLKASPKGRFAPRVRNILKQMIAHGVPEPAPGS